MKKLFYLSAFALCLGLSSTLNAQFITHNFNGSFGDFKVPKPDQESRVKITGNAVKTTWKEADYKGSNSNRKAQFEPKNQIQFTQELWIGFKLKVHSDYMKNNTNTEAGLMQIWGFNSSGSGNHWAMLKFDGRNGGDLTWQHRYNSSSSEQDYLVDGSFPRNTFKNIIIRVKLAKSNKGTVEIWVDGVRKLNKTNQTMGWGTQDDNGQKSGFYSSGAAFGQYNFLENAATTETYDSETTQYDGFLKNETRTVTYDNASVFVGANGYDIVDPTKSNKVVSMRKRNSSGFGIDGGVGGAKNQDVKLWNQNASNENQQWIEINRGGGFYSYQKMGTGFCLDGGDGGENRQNVKLFACSSTQRNQHWKKVNVTGSNYRLQKRNSSSYSIDGGVGGKKGNSLYLFKHGDGTNRNQHWTFNSRSTAKTATEKEGLSEASLEDNLDTFSAYPNPIDNNLTVQLSDNYDQDTSIALYAVNGQKVIETKATGESVNLDLSKLNSGIYILKINSKTQNFTKKIVKL